MDTIIDIQEVQAELDLAARDAQSGPAEVRAGYFVHEEAAKVSGVANHPVDQRHPMLTGSKRSPN
jgi:hypothetical protein